jgi:hypothetical protein
MAISAQMALPVVNVYAGSFVGGNIQIVGSGAADIRRVDIDGDLQFDDNNSYLQADNNRIGGNLQAFDNTGGVSITNNSIRGDLGCRGNFPPPTGYGNTVSGSLENQCIGFDRDASATATPIPPSATPLPTATTTPVPPTATRSNGYPSSAHGNISSTNGNPSRNGHIYPSTALGNPFTNSNRVSNSTHPSSRSNLPEFPRRQHR